MSRVPTGETMVRMANLGCNLSAMVESMCMAVDLSAYCIESSAQTLPHYFVFQVMSRAISLCIDRVNLTLNTLEDLEEEEKDLAARAPIARSAIDDDKLEKGGDAAADAVRELDPVGTIFRSPLALICADGVDSWVESVPPVLWLFA